MTTTYYVVPASRSFEASDWKSYPSRAVAEEVARDASVVNGDDYGVFEVRLVSGSAKLPYSRTMHIRGDRRIITARHDNLGGHSGGYSAHDDGLGEDGLPYGYGKTPEAAIEELLEALDHEQSALEEAR